MYSIKFSIEKEKAIFIVKKAVLFRYTIVKDQGDVIVVGTPPSFLTTITVKEKSMEFKGNVAISNSCCLAVKRELAKFEEKEAEAKPQEAKPAAQIEMSKEEMSEPVAERMELAALLKKYKELLDLNAISQEEYERRKAEILAMMEFEKKEEQQPKVEEPKPEPAPVPVVAPVPQPQPEPQPQPQPQPEPQAQPQLQPQPQVIQIINNPAPAPAPAQEAPVEEKKPRKNTGLYKIFAIIFSISLIAAAAFIIIFYFVLAKIDTDSLTGTNGLYIVLQSKLPMTAALTGTLLKDSFTVGSLYAAGVTAILAALSGIFGLLSLMGRRTGKITMSVIILLFGAGSLVYIIIAGKMILPALGCAIDNIFLGLLLFIFTFVKKRAKK